MFIVTVEFQIKPKYLNLFLEAVERQGRDSFREEGCIRFDICQKIEKKETIFLYEIYKDREAFQIHLSQNYFKKFSETIKPWVKIAKVNQLNLIQSNH